MGTKIEWCDDTINPITGCTPISEGCENCYAAAIARRFWGHRQYSEIKFHPERFEEFFKGKPGRKKFIGSMTDLYHPQVKPEWRSCVFSAIKHNPQHTFIILTKRPKLLYETYENHWSYANQIKNLWIGVTIENDKHYDRIKYLLEIPAAVRLVSVEPMLSLVNLKKIGGDQFGWGRTDSLAGLEYVRANALESGSEWETRSVNRIDWVICGAETGPKARPMQPEWSINLYNQCKEMGVPFFFKKASKGLQVPDYVKNCREYPRQP